MSTLGKDERALSAVDLFAGCGGMSLGFMDAGFDVARAYDNWDAAIKVYEKNFDHPIIKMDLTNEEDAIKSILEVSPELILVVRLAKIFLLPVIRMKLAVEPFCRYPLRVLSPVFIHAGL